MKSDLNRLRIFCLVFSHLSVSEAADELKITPSAVSQQLKKLEEELHTTLFTRLHRRLVPTQSGTRLYGLVEPMLNGLQAGIDLLEQERTEPSGRLHIGAPLEFGSVFLPRVIGQFREQYPLVNFQLELGRPSGLLPMVLEGRLDFAFIDTFPTRGQYDADTGVFSVEPLLEEQVVLACSRHYEESNLRGNQSFDTLSQCSFISQQSDAWALNNWFRHHFATKPAALQIVLTVENHQAVVSAIRHHLGLGIVIPHMIHEEIKTGTICVVRSEAEQAVNRISMVRLKDKVPPLSEKTFLVHLAHMLKQSRTLKRFNVTVL